MKKTLLNMEFGTFEVSQNKVTLLLPKQDVSMSETEIRYFINQQKDSNLFLPIVKFEDEDYSYKLTYDSEGYTSLKYIKKEDLAVRFSIAKSILDQDILKYEHYVSVNPSNIWYKPMQTVRYAYHGDRQGMPANEREGDIVRYKALLLYILIGHPYERGLNKDYQIKNNEMIKELLKAEDIEQLQDRLNQLTDQITYEQLLESKKRKQIIRALVAVGICLCLIASGSTFAVTKIYDAQKEDAIRADFDKEKQNLKYELEAQRLLRNGDFEGAATFLKEKGADQAYIAKLLVKEKQYVLALNYDPNILEFVIQSYYNQGKQGELLKLTLPKKVKNDLKEKLNVEKAIISYNTATLSAAEAFLEDRYTITRLIDCYTAHNDFLKAEDCVEKLKKYEYKTEYQYGKAILNDQEEKEKIKQAKKELSEAKKLPNTDKNKKNRITEIRTTLEQAQQNLSANQGKIEKAREALLNEWKREIEN